MSESPSPRDADRPGFRPLDGPAPDTSREEEPASFDPYALRPDPFGTGPKLPPRRPAPEPMRTAGVGAAGGFRRSATDDLPPPPQRTAPPGGGRRRLKVPIWAAMVGGLALAAALFAVVAGRRGDDGVADPVESEGPAIEVLDRPRDTPVPPAPVETASVRPTDADAVARAYDDAAGVYRTEGLPGLVARSRSCFADLQGAPAYDRLDYCLAFDAIGAALAQRLNGGAPSATDSWFGGVQGRGVEAVRRVAPDEADPASRVLDVRRVLGEVGRLRRAQAPAAAPPPVAPAPDAGGNSAAPVRPEPRVASPPPVSRSEPRPAPRAETRPAPVPPPSRPAVRPAPPPARPVVKAEPRPAAPPIARREPERTFSPSFNCRYARTRAEVAVCGDPQLSAADRALARAYEGAIARGADRRELRDEQDQWLRVRERAAPDPEAIEDAYRRRIRELDARGRPRRGGLDAWF